MNVEIKKKWLEALESGEYQKGKDSLKTENKFCCLGVLCDIYIKETGKGKWKKLIAHAYSHFMEEEIEEATVLPESVMVWAELKDNNPSINNDYHSITALNDASETFEDVIEAIKKEF